MNNFDEFVKQANAETSILSWEPVSGTGERLNVGALYSFNGEVNGSILIRDDVLRCMYGSAGDGAYNMIRVVLKSSQEVCKKLGMKAAPNSVIMSGFFLSESRLAFAKDENDLLRQLVLMHCSLGKFH